MRHMVALAEAKNFFAVAIEPPRKWLISAGGRTVLRTLTLTPGLRPCCASGRICPSAWVLGPCAAISGSFQEPSWLPTPSSPIVWAVCPARGQVPSRSQTFTIAMATPLGRLRGSYACEMGMAMGGSAPSSGGKRAPGGALLRAIQVGGQGPRKRERGRRASAWVRAKECRSRRGAPNLCNQASGPASRSRRS